MSDDLLGVRTAEGSIEIYLSGASTPFTADCPRFACPFTATFFCTSHGCNCAVFQAYFQTDRTCQYMGVINCNDGFRPFGCGSAGNPPCTQVGSGNFTGPATASRYYNLMSVPKNCYKFRFLTRCHCSGGLEIDRCAPRDSACGSYGCHTGVNNFRITGPCGQRTGVSVYTGAQYNNATCLPAGLNVGWLYFADICCCPGGSGSLSALSLNDIIKDLPRRDRDAITAQVAAMDERGEDPVLMLPKRRKPPNMRTRAVSLFGALKDWAKAGFETSSKSEVTRRKSICHSCENWDQSMYGGTGGCVLCGCSSLKFNLKSSECPIGKW